MTDNAKPDSGTPLLSIITITRNDADGLAATLSSIAAQGDVDYEHLIIDGASTDNTPAVLESVPTARRTLVSERDNGIYDAMNKGLAHASGEYVMFLNSGDTLHSDHTLYDIVTAIHDNDMPGVVYGQTDIVAGSDRHRVGPRHLTAPEALTLDSFKEGMVVCHQAFVALRRIVSMYNIEYRYSADYEWCIRVLQHSRNNVYIPDVLVDYLDGGVTTRHHLSSLLERYRIMCHYYNVVGSTLRHVRFAARAITRRLSSRSRAGA